MKYWLIATGIVVLVWVLILTVGSVGEVMERADLAILNALVQLRTDWLTRVMFRLHFLGSDWTIGLLRWGAVITLVVFRRWRHLFVFIGSVLVLDGATYMISMLTARPRPLGVEILGAWEGYAHPSRPVAALAVTLTGIAYSLVVTGRPRQIAHWVTGVLITALGASRLYLAVDHPSDVLFGAILGVAVPSFAFHWFTPEAAFPVVYRRGRTAHLDVGGRRGLAIRRALAEQLGLTVKDVKPVGLAGSAGSTPLRICVAGDPDRYLFAKLYAQNHLRSDRWYKLGRMLLYGAVEDEAPFSSVRQLVEYEDYMMRVMSEAGLPCAKTYGFVEITPEREYLIVTEFFEGAKEIMEVDVDDAVIDDGLLLVRKLWDAGLAHRDIKPANVMVRDGRVLVIDVAFGQVRPSPWRQAVDLANMMLVLAICTDTKRVYERALRLFQPEEIAEAFAATHGLTRPGLRTMQKMVGRNLLKEFRELAPERQPIRIQRWSFRRLRVTAGVLLLALLSLLLVFTNLDNAGLM